MAKWKNPVVEEIRKARDAHAAKFGHDLDAIVKDIQEQERKSGREFVSPPPRRPTLTLSPKPE